MRQAGKETLLDLYGGDRLAQQETLHLIAALGPYRVELLLGLHAFRGGRHTEAGGSVATARTMLSELALSTMFLTKDLSILI